MPYIGHGVTNAGTFYILDDLTMSSSTTYTMQVGGVNVTPKADNLLITLDGVVQHTPDAYTVSGSTITFDSAPGSGVDFYGIIMGQSATIGQGSIGADELKVSGDGTNLQVLVSDGDGTFSWLSQSALTPSANLVTGATLKSTITASSLTSVGTLTTLQVGGQNSTPKLEWFYDHSNGNDYKANISLAGNDLEVRGSNGAMEFYTGAVDGASSTLALSINSSQNATFAGTITATGEHHYFQNTGGNANVYIKASNSGNSRLYFGDVADVGAGFIDYDHGTSMALGTEGTTAMTIDSSQDATFVGTITVGASNGSEEVKANRTRVRHLDGLADASDYSHGDLYINHISSGNIICSSNVGVGHTTPQFGLTLAQGDTDATAIGWEDASNNKRASIYCGTSDDSLRFHVNGADRGRFETDGLFVAKTGIRLDGSVLSGSETGIGSSGNGGDLLFYSGGSSRARFDSVGRIFFGNDHTSVNLNEFQYAVNGSSSAHVLRTGLINRTTGTSTSRGNVLTLGMLPSGTISSSNCVAAGTTIGAISFLSNANSDSYGAGAIESILVTGSTSQNRSDHVADLAFKTKPSGNNGTREHLRINGAGHLVAQYLNQTGSTSNRYPLYWVHSGTNGSIEPYTGSVRAMKKDIADMGSVDWIHSLKPRSFKFRDFEDIDGVRTYKDTTKDNPTTEYGLIAEEVNEVEGSDYIVDKDSDGKVKGVLYHNLVPILLKAVQELSAKVEALENA
jgi:hypothetical protein